MARFLGEGTAPIFCFSTFGNILLENYSYIRAVFEKFYNY